MIRYKQVINFFEGVKAGLGLSFLGDLGDVDMVTVPPVEGDLLTYDSSTSPAFWKPKDPGTIFGPVSFGDFYNATGGTISTSTTWVPVPLDTERIKDSDYLHDNVTDNPEVTINSDDTYIVTGRVSVEGTGSNSRTEAEARLEIDTGGGFVAVPGTTGELYVRQTNYGASCSFFAALSLNTGDKLRIVYRREQGGGGVRLEANGSSLSIIKVKGVKGDKGDTGSGSNIIIQEDDLTVGTLTDILNFEGNGVTSVIDEGSGKTTITITDTNTTYTDAQIKTKYENNADTNAFTDADETKLDGIETGATADQSDAEIKIAYENNADTNAFTDADETKLDGIETGATADQIAAEVPYTPGTNGDWLVVPDDTKEGLDELASRILDVESASGEYTEKITTQTTTTTNAEYLTYTTGVLEAGDYEVHVSYVCNHSSTSSNARFRCQIDNTQEIFNPGGDGWHEFEPQDTGGDIRDPKSGHRVVTLTAGAHQIDFDFGRGNTLGTVSMYSAHITLKKL